MRVKADWSNHPEWGKYRLYVWNPVCPTCNSEEYHILDEWGNAGHFTVDEGDMMEGGFRGYLVVCEGCGERRTEDEYFYTDDDQARELMELQNEDLPIDDGDNRYDGGRDAMENPPH